MAFSRYRNDKTLRNGKIVGTNRGLLILRRRMQRGEIAFSRVTLKEGQRLDVIAQQAYGDARLWWVIAAASGIGWWLQAPPGTLLKVPTDLTQIEAIF